MIFTTCGRNRRFAMVFSSWSLRCPLLSVVVAVVASIRKPLLIFALCNGHFVHRCAVQEKQMARAVCDSIGHHREGQCPHRTPPERFPNTIRKCRTHNMYCVHQNPTLAIPPPRTCSSAIEPRNAVVSCMAYSFMKHSNC